jgi:F-type H+-transporting ATPase subunit b
MKLKSVLITGLVLVPAILLASSGVADGEISQYEKITGRTTDFIPRAFNFLLFAGILYYLLANVIRSYFVGRRESIAGQLSEIEAKLQASKAEKKAAEARIEEHKIKAEEIMETAGKEAQILASKISENSKQELEMMQKQYDEKIALEERKAARETIKEVLEANISADDIQIDQNKVIDLVSGKVA